MTVLSDGRCRFVMMYIEKQRTVHLKTKLLCVHGTAVTWGNNSSSAIPVLIFASRLTCFFYVRHHLNTTAAALAAFNRLKPSVSQTGLVCSPGPGPTETLLLIVYCGSECVFVCFRICSDAKKHSEPISSAAGVIGLGLGLEEEPTRFEWKQLLVTCASIQTTMVS